MSEQPQQPRRIRAGDADREKIVASLQAHREAGRLTAEEFESRMESALLAVWLDELPPLLEDLPTDGPSRPAGAGSDDRWTARDHRHADAPGPSDGGWPSRAARDRRIRCVRSRLVPVLALFLVIGSVAAVAHGHFPWPLLWVAFIVLWWRPWGIARRGWGRRPRW
jgi:hypothetical protein